MNTSDPAIRVLTGLVHDIRTPLHVMTLKLRLLEHKLAAHLDDEDRSDFVSLQAAIDSILELQTRVLDRARADEWSLRVEEAEFALDELIGICVDEIKPLATQKGLSLVVKLQPNQVVRSDRHKIERVVRNLLANAVRYTREGQVTVSTRVGERSLEVDVCDTGVGIAPDDHDRIFDAYFRADPHNSHGGHGLGLAIAREMARAIGGKLSVSSQLGVGSVFTLSLPLCVLNLSTKTERQPASPAAGKSAASQPDGKPAVDSALAQFRRRVKVLNDLGLHLRAAQKFVQLAQQYHATVRVIRDEQFANGKSILELAMLAVERGAHIEVEADGPDAVEAISALCDLVDAGFFETTQSGGEYSGQSTAIS